MDIRLVFLLFIIYSIIGYFIELLDIVIHTKKISDRGFLIGPYLPIFGSGALLLIFLLSGFENVFIIFILSCLIGATLEYITSYVMEKMFKTRWWDYSHEKFNLNGRICLRPTIAFGILGVILIKFLNPFLISILNNIPDLILTVITILIALIFLIDIIISFKIISHIKLINMQNKDATDEITQIVKNTLQNHSKFSRRLVRAFPNFIVK